MCAILSLVHLAPVLLLGRFPSANCPAPPFPKDARTYPWTWKALPSTLNVVASSSTLSSSITSSRRLWPIHRLELALLFSVCFLLGLFRACHRSTGDVERMHKGSLLEMILLPIMVSPRLSSVVQQNCTGSQRPDNKLSLATHSL